MKYHLLCAALIVTAVMLEFSGYANGRSNFGAALFTAGTACEFFFWMRLGSSGSRDVPRRHPSNPARSGSVRVTPAICVNLPLPMAR